MVFWLLEHQPLSEVYPAKKSQKNWVMLINIFLSPLLSFATLNLFFPLFFYPVNSSSPSYDGKLEFSENNAYRQVLPKLTLPKICWVCNRPGSPSVVRQVISSLPSVLLFSNRIEPGSWTCCFNWYKKLRTPPFALITCDCFKNTLKNKVLSKLLIYYCAIF